MISDQIDEAIGLIDGMLDLLQRSVNSPQGRPAYQLRSSIGYLRANAEKSIKQRTIGTDIGACFNAAIAAGAIPERLESVRRYLLDTPAQGEVGQLIGGYSILMCLSAISIQGMTVTYRNQDEAMAAMAYTQGIFQQAKDAVADQTPVAVYNALNKLAATATRYLSSIKLQLPRVLTYRTMTTLPALTLSNLIFRTGDRSDEIVDENSIVHPAFCPRELRVLSQ